MKRKHKGFTLIELLVVIAVIGLLASVILVSLNNARSKSRDTRRRLDLRQINTALALYYDANSAYPSTGGGWWGTCSGFGGHGTSGPTGWVPNLAPTFMAVLPTDPKPFDPLGCYVYRSDGIDFKLFAYTTVENPISTSDNMYDPTRTTNSLAIWTPGAAPW